MKNALIALFLCPTLIFFLGCPPIEENNADNIQAQQTKEAMSEANRQIGMPAITNYQERKLAKMIFELRDKEDFVCHAYLVNQLDGSIGQYLGPCIGYGLPYSVQFTNPQRVMDVDVEMGRDTYNDNGRYQVVPQPDPNGLFMPEGLSATWLMLLDKDGEPHPVYIEPEIIVSPFPLHKMEVEQEK